MQTSDENLNPIPIHDGIGNGTGMGLGLIFRNFDGTGMGLGLKILQILIANPNLIRLLVLITTNLDVDHDLNVFSSVE
jgi:hypothetical protein